MASMNRGSAFQLDRASSIFIRRGELEFTIYCHSQNAVGSRVTFRLRP